jgi:predicted kinase
MVGLPCSGKTAVARELETRYSALRLTTDEWHVRLFGDDFGDERHHETHNARHEALEFLLWGVAARALVLGVDVILDFGCWVKSQREEFRARAHQLGAEFRIHFMDASEQVLLDRLAQRNAERPEGTFRIPEHKLREWIELFEPPSKDELERSSRPA